MTSASDFQQGLEQFRADFARQVPPRLREAQQFLQACLAQPQDDAPLRDLHRVLHKLAGSAGTFGQRALGDEARALEEALDVLLATPGRSASQYEAVAERLGALAASWPD